jgi:hypothetical protein
MSTPILPSKARILPPPTLFYETSNSPSWFALLESHATTKDTNEHVKSIASNEMPSQETAKPATRNWRNRMHSAEASTRIFLRELG